MPFGFVKTLEVDSSNLVSVIEDVYNVNSIHFLIHSYLYFLVCISAENQSGCGFVTSTVL